MHGGTSLASCRRRWQRSSLSIFAQKLWQHQGTFTSGYMEGSQRLRGVQRICVFLSRPGNVSLSLIDFQTSLFLQASQCRFFLFISLIPHYPRPGCNEVLHSNVNIYTLLINDFACATRDLTKVWKIISIDMDLTNIEDVNGCFQWLSRKPGCLDK